MPWLILLLTLILPFVFTSLYRRLWARIGLAAVWLSAAGGAVFFFRGAAELQQDLDTVDRYELPSSTGDHTLPIRRLSQGSMLGVLAGGEGRPSKAELERLKWTFLPGVRVQWFDVGEQDFAAGEVPLFQVGWVNEQDSLSLSYCVGDADADVLKSRVLLVRHDVSAQHLLRDHGTSIVRSLAWATALWGGWWLLVQTIAELMRRRRPENVETTRTG